MKLRTRPALILSAAILASCATRDVTGYEIVRSTLAVGAVARASAGKNLYPWERNEAAPGEILISNACGFVDLVYAVEPLSKYVSAPDKALGTPTSYRALSGEWCEVRDFSFNWPTLVHFRTWRGVKYLLSSAPISRDAGGPPYVSDRGFISDLERERWGPKRLEDPTCCVKRIYLADLMLPANYRLERP